jgi:hypothetical protein
MMVARKVVKMVYNLADKKVCWWVECWVAVRVERWAEC